MASESFYITVIGLVTAFLGLALRFAYKSKCSHVKCCCFDVVRDVNGEERNDLHQINHMKKMNTDIDISVNT